ncbi:MAG: hypothetical protein EOP84_02870 [Verrucomicrobiaceae bacterium]|nr:MAG: hypothetical protein EOP84_02870 [Verrucomicrobiaceae bacterium]
MSDPESIVILVDQHDGVLSQTLHYGVSEKDRLIARWYRDIDPLLAQLQRHEPFKGRLRWSDLDHEHFRTLLALHYTLACDLPLSHRERREHPVMRSIDILLVAYMVFLEKRMQGHVSLMVVTRITPMECRYAVTTELDTGTIPPPRPHGLRVIVNNT